MVERLTGRNKLALGGSLHRMLDYSVYAARWIMAALVLGLLVCLAVLVVKFAQKIVLGIPDIIEMSTNQAISLVLTLVDLCLVGNLVFMVMLAGWIKFLGRSEAARGEIPSHWTDRPDFGAIKLQLIAAVVAIASVQMLETFIHINEVDKTEAYWQLAILLGFGTTGVLLVAMDRLAGAGK